MKAKVKETGEIIDVKCLCPVIYSRLSGGKIIDEYDEDELELIIPPRPKMIPLDKACEWIEALNNEHHIMSYTDNHILNTDELLQYFKNFMED